MNGPAGLTIILLACLLLLLLSVLLGFLYWQAKRRSRVKAERLERLLTEIRSEAERLGGDLSKIEKLGKVLEEKVFPAVASMRFEEALKELEEVDQVPLGVECEVEAYKSRLEAVKALREACRDAVKAWVMEAVRLHLPQTAKNWRTARHGYSKELDELLAYSMAGLVEANPQSLLEWFKAGNPAMYDALAKLVDSSESLEVFFRMIEKTLGELEYVRAFREKYGEACAASRLRAALELERRKTMDRIEGLSSRLLKS
ncbi:MAG: hypothetical protein ACXQTQ_05485 [Candidatus Hecatellaceae archaeon]|nr:MAG: hypothetical protein DRO43_02155 [Candidatus Hecatellales archaeon]